MITINTSISVPTLVCLPQGYPPPPMPDAGPDANSRMRKAGSCFLRGHRLNKETCRQLRPLPVNNTEASPRDPAQRKLMADLGPDSCLLRVLCVAWPTCL